MKKYLKYFLFVLTINIFVFLCLELILHIFNLFPPPKFFSESKDGQGRVEVQYLHGKLKPKFLKNKGENTYRIFSFGGSTTMGSPYYPKSSFSRMLELALNKSGPAKKVELINLGASGMNSLEIVYCLREALQYNPDLALIYVGQNEFFAASLFPDWRHPYLHRALDILRLHSRIYQALKSSDKILTVIPAAIGTRQEIAEKANLDFEQLPMENRPMSKKFYHDRIQSYRYHLDEILSTLERNKVPTVICTVTVNLKDWPPEWTPFPEKLAAQQQVQLKNDLYASYLDIADGKLDQAEQVLAKLKPIAIDYAEYYFVLARLLEKKGDLEKARENFLLARKFDNSRHRAPPEINPIIRELAKKHRATLVDIEELFFREAKTTPGFDLFEDHVHPNLYGQRLIAQKIYMTLVADNNRTIVLRNPMSGFPSEDEMKTAFGMDENFMDDIKFKLSLYYLLQRRLPDRDQRTIDYLTRVFSRHPENIFAGVCLASVLLEQSREAEAEQVFARAVKSAGGTDQFQKMLLHYFFPKITMQGEYLMVHLNLDPAAPPMRGIMLVRAAPEETYKKSGMDLDQYDWIFRYHPGDNQFEDITKSALATYKSTKGVCPPEARKELDVKSLFLQHPQIFSFNDLAPDVKGKNPLLELTGKDPWLYFPVKLDAVSARSAAIEISVSPENRTELKSEIDLYWSVSPKPVFSEDKKMSLPLKTDGKFQRLEFNLSSNLNWLVSQEVSFLRIDPGSLQGQCEIREFKIKICPAPPLP